MAFNPQNYESAPERGIPEELALLTKKKPFNPRNYDGDNNVTMGAPRPDDQVQGRDPYYSNRYNADLVISKMFRDLAGTTSQELGNQRTGGGGSGGGSMDFEGNMDANPLISLNPYLEENITSFNHGGNMRSMRMPKYDDGGSYANKYYNQGGIVDIYNQGGAMHQMPDGSMMAGATHPQSYNQGGSFLQQANQSIQANQQANEQRSMAQLSALVANSLQNKMSPKQATSMASQMAEQSGLVNQPMANQGMRMRKRYTQGGRF